MSTPSDIIRDTIPGAGSTGQETIGTSVSQISTVATQLFTGVRLKAPTTNTAIIYVGFSADVSSTTGYPLEAGDDLPVSVEDVKQLHFITTAGTETLAWLAH